MHCNNELWIDSSDVGSWSLATMCQGDPKCYASLLSTASLTPKAQVQDIKLSKLCLSKLWQVGKPSGHNQTPQQNQCTLDRL